MAYVGSINIFKCALNYNGSTHRTHKKEELTTDKNDTDRVFIVE